MVIFKLSKKEKFPEKSKRRKVFILESKLFILPININIKILSYNT